MIEPSTAQAPKPTELTLKPARIDFLGAKTEMIMAIIISVLACLTVYSPILSSGFLLDDFLHLDYVAKALTGDWGSFLANFTGNWADSDIMKSYRPLVSLSLFLDYLAWGTNAWGFHLCNLFLTMASAATVGLITMELSGLRGNRLYSCAAIWTALLFVLYPLHPEASAWIIGRVDLLCTFFYLASIFAYLRFRAIREKAYFHFSLFAFVAALLSKEMAVTLPLVIALAELCLYNQNKDCPIELRAKLKHQQLTVVLSYWFVLGIVASFRLLMLGTFIGGYDTGGPGLLHSACNNFSDKASLFKILYPLNEEIPVFAWIKPTLLGAYFVALASALVRIAHRSISWRIMIFLLGWTALALLPTYQIWHIHPNLVGSRLFYLSSAPLVIFLVFLALPTIDQLPKRWVKATAICGSIALTVIALTWALILECNLKPWIEAGKRMIVARQQLSSALDNAGHSDNLLLFLNLPTDYAGAGMLTRPSYLQILCRPPFFASNQAARLRTIEPEVSGSHEFLWPGEFELTNNNSKVTNRLIWQPETGRFADWQNDGGQDQYDFQVQPENKNAVRIEPSGILPSDPTKWSIEADNGTALSFAKDYVRIKPGQETVSLILPPSKINPLLANLAYLQLTMNASDRVKAMGKIKLIWHQSTPNDGTAKVWPWHEAMIRLDKADEPLWLGRYRTWTLSPSIDSLGIRFLPGDYEAEFRSLTLGSDKSNKPIIRLLTGDKLQYSLPQGLNATSCDLIVTGASATFDANSELEIAEPQPANSRHPHTVRTTLKSGSGELEIPQNLVAQPGLHQIRIQLYDAAGKTQGLPSEPVSITTPKSGKSVD